MNNTLFLFCFLALQSVSSFLMMKGTGTNHVMKLTHHSTTRNKNYLHLLPPDISHGQEIFRHFCSSCHAGGTNAISRERDLHKEALEKFIGLSEEEDSIIAFVKNSNVHRGALAFTGRLSDQDLKDVCRFVYIQSIENKW